LRSTPAASVIPSARALLELGVKLRESVELEERLAALEQRLGDAKK
jgi:hypothetical protein